MVYSPQQPVGQAKHVGTAMSLQGLAYNLRRVMNILGIAGTVKAISLVGT
jgi:hypothetical protein